MLLTSASRSSTRLRTTAAQLRIMSWQAAFPTPRATPAEITPAELAAMPGVSGVDYIVVDARRTDIDEEGAPRTMHAAAINLPAQSFFPTVPVAGKLLKSIPKVIFHCNSCKPGGRGPRTAGWYQDWLDENGETGSRAYVLRGGWKAWMAEYPDKVVKF